MLPGLVERFAFNVRPLIHASYTCFILMTLFDVLQLIIISYIDNVSKSIARQIRMDIAPTHTPSHTDFTSSFSQATLTSFEGYSLLSHSFNKRDWRFSERAWWWWLSMAIRCLCFSHIRFTALLMRWATFLGAADHDISRAPSPLLLYAERESIFSRSQLLITDASRHLLRFGIIGEHYHCVSNIALIPHYYFFASFKHWWVTFAFQIYTMLSRARHYKAHF